MWANTELFPDVFKRRGWWFWLSQLHPISEGIQWNLTAIANGFPPSSVQKAVWRKLLKGMMSGTPHWTLPVYATLPQVPTIILWVPWEMWCNWPISNHGDIRHPWAPYSQLMTLHGTLGRDYFGTPGDFRNKKECSWEPPPQIPALTVFLFPPKGWEQRTS